MVDDRQIGLTWSRRLCAGRLEEIMNLLEPGRSMADVAADAGIPYVQLQNFHDGSFVPSVESVSRVAEALGVAPQSLRVLDIGTDGLRKAANVAARAIAQAGWIFGLEPAGDADLAVLAPTSNFLRDAFRRWAHRYVAPGRGAGARPSRTRREYLSWRYRFGVGCESKGWDGGFDVGNAWFSYRRSMDRDAWRRAHETSSEDTARSISLGRYAEQLRSARKASGMTQTQLAARSGASLSAVKLYETKRTLPKERTNEAIASALGVMPESFLIYNIDSPLQFIHTLMDLSEALGFEPTTDGGGALVAKGARARRLSHWWGVAWDRLIDHDPDSYRDWYDRYDDGASVYKLPRHGSGSPLA